MHQSLSGIRKELNELADREIAAHSSRFFKTGEGEYGFGDKFLGIRVPEIRKISRKYVQLDYADLRILLRSKYHEERFAALAILVFKSDCAKTEMESKSVFDFYVDHMKHVNNWDLVDISCTRIIGRYLINKDKDRLYEWANSNHIWTRRISIISTLWFVRNDSLDDAFRISEILLKDSHDLIHKATGWVLRECGKKEIVRLEEFLNQHYTKMPRTMLRYAIERLPEPQRKMYLKGEF